jgi:hypothetical protein
MAEESLGVQMFNSNFIVAFFYILIESPWSEELDGESSSFSSDELSRQAGKILHLLGSPRVHFYHGNFSSRKVEDRSLWIPRIKKNPLILA